MVGLVEADLLAIVVVMIVWPRSPASEPLHARVVQLRHTDALQPIVPHRTMESPDPLVLTKNLGRRQKTARLPDLVHLSRLCLGQILIHLFLAINSYEYGSNRFGN